VCKNISPFQLRRLMELNIEQWYSST